MEFVNDPTQADARLREVAAFLGVPVGGRMDKGAEEDDAEEVSPTPPRPEPAPSEKTPPVTPDASVPRYTPPRDTRSPMEGVKVEGGCLSRFVGVVLFLGLLGGWWVF